MSKEKSNQEYWKAFPIRELKRYENNPKQHGRKQLDKIKQSIREFGFINPILADENCEIIAGHGRLTAAEEMGYTQVPALIIKGLTQEQKKAYRIADNKLTEMGDWDMDLLNRELESLNLSGFDVQLTGFNYKPQEPETQEDDPSIPPLDQITTDIQQGDIFTIGENVTLACGDCKDNDLIKRALGKGRNIDGVFTDPPYGVSYKGTNNPNGREWEVIQGDDLRGNALYELLVGSFQAISNHAIQKVPLYVCYASKNHYEFEKALNDAGFKVKQQLIWHKHHVLGHSDYHWTHEPILYASRQENNCNFYGDRTNKTFILNNDLARFQEMTKEELLDLVETIQENSTVWHMSKDAPQNYVHPTQKPVDLAAIAVKNGTQKGETVFDPFAGSGSTLMAAYQLGRQAVGVELDPRYVKAILLRFRQYDPKLEIKATTNADLNKELK